VILRLTHIVLLIVAVCFTGCNPWRLPGFKQEAKRQDERITRETDEAIRKSAGLQELDHLCTQEIPRPSKFALDRKYRDYNEEKFLGYGYQSDADYQSVKSFYLKYFNEHGWQIIKEKDGGWGPSEIEFGNERYRLTVYDKGKSEGGTYDVVCARL
jgi:hypothetical protein